MKARWFPVWCSIPCGVCPSCSIYWSWMGASSPPLSQRSYSMHRRIWLYNSKGQTECTPTLLQQISLAFKNQFCDLKTGIWLNDAVRGSIHVLLSFIISTTAAFLRKDDAQNRMTVVFSCVTFSIYQYTFNTYIPNIKKMFYYNDRK